METCLFSQTTNDVNDVYVKYYSHQLKMCTNQPHKQKQEQNQTLKNSIYTDGKRNKNINYRFRPKICRVLDACAEPTLIILKFILVITSPACYSDTFIVFIIVVSIDVIFFRYIYQSRPRTALIWFLSTSRFVHMIFTFYDVKFQLILSQFEKKK